MGKKLTTADDLYLYQFPHDINCSPGCGHIAFILSQIDREADNYRHDICLLNPGNGTFEKLTETGDITAFCWLSDEELLLQSVKTGVCRFCLKTKEVTKAFSIPVKTGLPVPLGNGIWLIQTKRATDPEPEQDDRAKEGIDFWTFTDKPFIRNGEEFSQRRRVALGIFDETTEQINYITGKYYETAGYDISFDKKMLLYFGEDYKDCSSFFRSLHIYNIENGTTRELIAGGKFQISMAKWLASGKILLQASTLDRAATQNHDIYLLDPETRELQMIQSPDGMYSAMLDIDTVYGGGRTAKISGDNLIAIRLRGMQTSLDELNSETGNIRSITLADALTSFDIYGDYCYMTALENYELTEIYQVRCQTGEKEKLTDFSREYMSSHTISMPEYIGFTAKNQEKVEGYVIPPAGFDASKKYPGILFIHGGPKWAYGKMHMHLFQCLAAKGMYVFYCNPHGSDGYGEDFLEMAKEWGQVDYRHLMEFTDECLRKHPNLDGNRLGVSGGSYGGYMTNWIIGHTNRFRAAVSQRGICNLVTISLLCDLGERVMQQSCGNCTPWDGEELMWEQSPLKYAKNVTTPTLFLHSEKDYRCFMGEAFQMFTALKQTGVETEMYLFHEENHSLSRSGKPSHRIERVEAIIKWFEKYL